MKREDEARYSILLFSGGSFLHRLVAQRAMHCICQYLHDIVAWPSHAPYSTMIRDIYYHRNGECQLVDKVLDPVPSDNQCCRIRVFVYRPVSWRELGWRLLGHAAALEEWCEISRHSMPARRGI